MKTTILTALAAVGTVVAQQGAYQQCGGTSYTGSTSCIAGYQCHVYNEYYSQCLPGSAENVPSPTTASPTKGKPTKAKTTKAKPTKAKPTKASPTQAKPTTAKPTTKTTTTPASSAPTGSSGEKVAYAGINIAGFDFGCGTDGTCDTASTDPPANGNAQMKHFVTDDGLNAFRLPVAWQYLVNNQLGGTLNAANLATYDGLVQGCVNAGAAMCIIDIHNYARWNGQIVGQTSGGPTDKDLASLWSQLATKYKSNSKIAFGIMNEPHDLDITTWATTVQASVTAIRAAGATSQKILLPGTDYTSASEFISNGSGAALMGVKNPDGTTTNLIFDVHKYLDSDNSGTNAECATNNVDVFTTLGNWLRQEKRQAILTETGGGSDAQSCFTDLCQELAELNTYSDVFLGYLGWAAGAFDTSYVLSETPTLNGNTWTDQPLVSKCIVAQFK